MKNLASPLSAMLAAVLLLSGGCASESAVSEDTLRAAGNLETREEAPNFTLKDANGQDVSLADFKGKVVLLNFWATWCGPCKIEMPWFVEFQRKYKDRGFSVLAVSLDEEGWEVVKPFAEEMKLNFPIVVGNDDIATEFGGVKALPTTFVIDKEGKIASQHMGLVSKGDYEHDIESLL